MISNENFSVREYTKADFDELYAFFTKVLLESGRAFEPNGAHKCLLHVEETFDEFVLLIEPEGGKVIGTCALKAMDETRCELKCVYLYKAYHGHGLGTKMSQMIIELAKDKGFKEMYLDVISKSGARAIRMYERLGFERTKKYHEASLSDVFMKKIL